MKTIVNGKTIKLFDKVGIGVEFTKVVNEYLQNGFVFNIAESSRGSQGEEMRVNLTKDGGNTVYVIYVDRRNYDVYYQPELTLIVEKFENAKYESTLWFGRGELVSERIFYCVSDFHKEVFVDNEADFKLIAKISNDRRYARYINDKMFRKLPISANKVALRILKNMKGYKSIPLKNIEYVAKDFKKGFAVKLVDQTCPIIIRK